MISWMHYFSCDAMAKRANMIFIIWTGAYWVKEKKLCNPFDSGAINTTEILYSILLSTLQKRCWKIVEGSEKSLKNDYKIGNHAWKAQYRLCFNLSKLKLRTDLIKACKYQQREEKFDNRRLFNQADKNIPKSKGLEAEAGCIHLKYNTIF